MKHLNLLFLSTAALLSSCGGGGGTAAEPPAPPPPAALAPQVTLAVSNGAGVSGNIVITMTPDQTPISVANFLAYVRSGFFNGTVIHRNSPGFVLQGGGYAGPLVAGSSPLPTLKPNSVAPIVLEDATSLSNLRWTVAMARTTAPDSATSQFFINLADNTNLNRTTAARGYAVIGTITAGTDVVTAMAAAPCTAWPALLFTGECLPSPNLTITSATQTR
jgi:peptidyl-prolyl cis-trans isomerase A (cyclophilin A)